MQTLGNRAYKSGEPVEVVDYPAGRAILAALDKPAILMRVCSNYQTCYRRTVAELLRADGFEVQEILPDGGQLPLF
jgi:hypothetical protein